jgi:hypothetical protein
MPAVTEDQTLLIEVFSAAVGKHVAQGGATTQRIAARRRERQVAVSGCPDATHMRTLDLVARRAGAERLPAHRLAVGRDNGIDATSLSQAARGALLSERKTSA